MAFGEPGIEALTDVWRRLGRRDPQHVEAEAAGPLGKGGLQGLAA